MVTTTLYTLSRGVSLFSSSLRRTQMSMTITLGEIINTISINLKKGNGLNFNLKPTISEQQRSRKIRSHKGSRIKAIRSIIAARKLSCALGGKSIQHRSHMKCFQNHVEHELFQHEFPVVHLVP